MMEDAGETLKLRRCLKLLNGILKEFASIKLPNGMKAMAQVPSFYLYIYGTCLSISRLLGNYGFLSTDTTQRCL